MAVGTTATFTKGMMVKVRVDRPAYGDYPARLHDLWRPTTREDKEAWYASDASKGMDSAGESKLPPQSRYRATTEDEVFRIVRARVKARKGWHDIPGCAEVEDADGKRWFVRRKHLY